MDKTQTSKRKPPRFIARQLVLGFGTVTIVAVAMCGMLLAIIHDVSGLVSEMRHEESSIRQGLELATAVRELSVHIGHSLIEADESHLAHYEVWLGQVQSRADDLAQAIPEDEQFRLATLRQEVDRMDEVFKAMALPAVRRGDTEATLLAFREIDALGTSASAHADSLARSVESQMAKSHVMATDSTRAGLLGGGLCIVLVVGLSVGFTLRLRGAVLRPLGVLTRAARGFGRGDFRLRVGDIGRGELGALGGAFDRMAEELARREEKLVHSERMAAIGQLAAGVAHELNNPIAIIRGYLKTMSPEGDVESLREELAILDEEAAQCQRIAEDLLTYARIEDLAFERFQMGPFLRETARRYQESVAGAELELTLDVDDVDLQGDRARIRQVVLNLLTNATQASPPGSPIHIRGVLRGDEYEIEIEDRGPGVAAEERQRIFEPFHSTRPGGSGLGLAVCEGIVLAHHGTIDVLPSDRGGSTFRVSLPLVQGPTEDWDESSSK